MATGITQEVMHVAAVVLLLLSPLGIADPPLAVAHEGMSHDVEGSAAASYQCTPLNDMERVDAFGDFKGYAHSIATDSQPAQRLFDQGLLLAYNYNQPEALNAFQAGLRYDPEAPMLHWGIAYALGPYMNKVAAAPPANQSYPVFSDDERLKGREALRSGSKLVMQQLASAELPGGDAVRATKLRHDKLYLDALANVFEADSSFGPAFEAGMQANAAALQGIAGQYAQDADAPALAAEALSNLQPWDFWEPTTLQPKGHTTAVLGLLTETLRRDPIHPLASHMMVHVTEASRPGRGPNSAGRAEAAADTLLASHPTFGHLTHMASHTYLRVGRWHDAVTSNARALEIDVRDAKRCLQPYMPVHNASMLIAAANQGAEQRAAEEWAARVQGFAKEFGPTYMTDGRDRSQLPLVHARFANWEPILRLSPSDLDPSLDGVMLPPSSAQVGQVTYHYVRTLALAAKAQRVAGAAGGLDSPEVERARQGVVGELEALRAAAAALPNDPITKPGSGIGIWSPGHKSWSAEALQVAEARVAALNGDLGKAAKHLEQAVYLEPLTGYAEPPRFYQPARQCLAWVLLQHGDLDDAAAVYGQDLEEYPESPWSLVGLRGTLAALLDQQSQGVAVAPRIAESAPVQGAAATAVSAVPRSSLVQPPQVASASVHVAETAAVRGDDGATSRQVRQQLSAHHAALVNQDDPRVALRQRLADVNERVRAATVMADPTAPLTSSCPAFAEY